MQSAPFILALLAGTPHAIQLRRSNEQNVGVVGGREHDAPENDAGECKDPDLDELLRTRVEGDVKSVTTNKGGAECLCPEGKFFHNQDCVSQGGEHYECGVFPKEIWPRVCLHGFYCKPLEGADNYRTGLEWGAAPASCESCENG